ncbi:oxygen-independent coproporphyrinogen-3 oxidase [Lachnospiraceae bacterium NE2001]|nr:oxygen-independent coproporphyrinogen-3 oxidase [Lachnospiraceae bacterium NE2001]
MILLVQNDKEYETDLREMISAFFSHEKINVSTPSEVASFEKERFGRFRFMLTALFDEKNASLRLEEKGHVLYSAYIYGDYKNRKRYRNKLKLAIYRLLSEYTKRDLPWGSLTGMRPTKIATQALAKGKTKEEIVDYYNYTYDASIEKAQLATDVALKEKSIIESVNPLTDYCLYINIPFCPTKCLYCSFAAYPITDYERHISDYIAALKQELQHIAFINRNRNLVAVYMGGGTPTSLNSTELGSIIQCVRETFDISLLREFTVEAGRPDSITREKLEMLKKNGVTRISINPQTMNADTLRKIGRAHTPADIKRAMNDARKAGFKNINMDIIAGLPGETIFEMEYTLDELADLAPESLTVHSLAIKRAANLNERYDEFSGEINHDTDKMLSLVAKRAEKAGLEPYYLYRQKNIAGNLENVGYSKPGLECIYNILIMEESVDTFAAGAGAVTRLLTTDNGKVTRVDRVENCKNVDEYMLRIDEMLERKNAGVASRMLT